MRKTYDTAFKVKVAIEAIKGHMTLGELAQKYQIHPVQVSQWKKQLLEGADGVFERPNKKRALERKSEEEHDRLLKTVGQLKVENDFLKKKHREYYGSES